MKFNLLIFINLAGVISIESSSPNLDSCLRDQLIYNCSSVVRGTVKNSEDCGLSEKKPSIEYGVDALPYVCLLCLDVATEFCKVPDRLKKLGQMNTTKSVCPIDYPLKSRNLRVDITKGVQYMSDEKNCSIVCGFNSSLSHVCQFIAFASKIIKEEIIEENSYRKKVYEKQSQDLLKKDKSNGLAEPAKITQNIKLTAQTNPKVSQGKILGNTDPSVADKFNISNSLRKIDSNFINEKSGDGNADVKTYVDYKKTDSFIQNNNNNKNVSEKFVGNKTSEKTILKKSQVVLSDGNTDIPETELPSSPDNLHNIKNSQNNNSNNNSNNKININNDNVDNDNSNDNNNVNNNKKKNNKNNNNNDNNNNNNNEYGDGSAFKTPPDGGEDVDNNDEDLEKSGLQDALSDREPQFAKSLNPKEIYSSDNFFQAEDSHFSVYFLTTVSIIIIGYVIYHNKKKIVAYALEGRRNKNGRRRPTSASYRKLDCNLEEAIASNPSNTSVTNVVY